jgi:mRNA-degrading endonuclease toxin of MazEF toxin-antitoxin module
MPPPLRWWHNPERGISMLYLNYGDIVCVDVPYNVENPHQVYGRHYYVVMSNRRDLNSSPNVVAVPLSSNIERTYIGQRNIKFDCLNAHSKILGGQLSVFPKHIFLNGKWMGRVTKTEMDVIHSCIKEYLSIPN